MTTVGDGTRLPFHQIVTDAGELEMKITTDRDGEMTTEAPTKIAQGNAPTAHLGEVIGENVNIIEESAGIVWIVPMMVDVDDTGIRPKTGIVIVIIVIVEDTVIGMNMRKRTGLLDDVEAEVYLNLDLLGDDTPAARHPHKRSNAPNAPFPPKQTHIHPLKYQKERKGPPLRPQKNRSPILHLPGVWLQRATL